MEKQSLPCVSAFVDDQVDWEDQGLRSCSERAR